MECALIDACAVLDDELPVEVVDVVEVVEVVTPVDGAKPVDAVGVDRTGSAGNGRCVPLNGCDCDSAVGRDGLTSATLDEVLRSRSDGTGIGAGRGLRGMTLFLERPVGLSSLGGDVRAGVRLLVLTAGSADDPRAVPCVGLLLVLVPVPAVLVVLVVMVVGVVGVVVPVLLVVVAMVWLRGLVPESDMLAPMG